MNADVILADLQANWEYFHFGLDPDMLNEWPAMRLLRVQFDTQEIVEWPAFWLANGGQLHGGGMVALKWDPVWCRISAFGVPVAPFQVGSGYDLEDVDRDEAESFGLIRPRDRVPLVKYEFDPAALKVRIAALLPPPCNRL